MWLVGPIRPMRPLLMALKSSTTPTPSSASVSRTEKGHSSLCLLLLPLPPLRDLASLEFGISGDGVTILFKMTIAACRVESELSN